MRISFFPSAFAPSEFRISFFTSVLRRPGFGFHFSQVFCVVRVSDFIFHKCFTPSEFRISFFTSVLHRPGFGFHFSQVFCVVRVSDFIFHKCFVPSQLGAPLSRIGILNNSLHFIHNIFCYFTLGF